jgi:hypothetical protein
MADIAGHRDNEHDPERSSEMAAKADAVGQALFIGALFGLAI